jgi:hypothetical protein
MQAAASMSLRLDDCDVSTNTEPGAVATGFVVRRKACIDKGISLPNGLLPTLSVFVVDQVATAPGSVFVFLCCSSVSRQTRSLLLAVLI